MGLYGFDAVPNVPMLSTLHTEHLDSTRRIQIWRSATGTSKDKIMLGVTKTGSIDTNAQIRTIMSEDEARDLITALQFFVNRLDQE